MKKKKIIGYIAFVLIFCVLLTGTYLFLKLTDINTLVAIKGYEYEKENELDVVMFGQSEVYTGFIPTIAWEKYGYTSYCYGMAGMPANMYASALDEVLKSQKPKLLVVEITAFTKNDDYYNRPGQMHGWIDNLPFNRKRIDTITNYVPEEMQDEYYKPISTYHGNWKLPENCAKCLGARILLAVNRHSTLKGYATQANYMDKKPKKHDAKFTFNDTDKKYLKEFIDKCKEAQLENVLFVRFPHARKIVNQDALKEIGDFISAEGFEFVDYNRAYKRTGIVQKKDFYNVDHMNIFGAEKFTDFFGEYIKNKYNLNTVHDQDCIDRWNEDAQKAKEYYKLAKENTKKKTRKYIFEYANK